MASRDREPFASLLLYHLFKWSVVSPMYRVYFRGRVDGAHHVPQRGPVIVVANHGSDFDPPILSSCVQRPVSYMAKEELFQVPVLAPAIRLYGAYPVKRGSADRSAIREALKQLDQGWAVGVFLEGTRTDNGRIPSPKLGAALIAAKAQVPLLPVSLWGTHRILPKGGKWPRTIPLTVRISSPVPPPASTNKELLWETTRRCTDTIHQLHNLGR
ncbi:lysophospholipid acyltransferase family protein [Oscillatoria sp. CS-180]|uniref:lysophospholipid acyltransferase family protein n=1 Tax=Oscillatoria sp. CS-180 TaxID=3021720 RepID=UPI00232B0233|nr:lysophospholipid acyltransferase family protein [Oscillatoria sp. CS-180]MDB9528829.1 lysophospholipid acyltransferase family protein [Oscillatoria sp. CS-180]